MRAIQYKALKIAYKKPLKTTNTELLTLSKATKLDERIKILNEKYFENCIKFNNELVKEIVKNYLNWYTINRNSKYKTILCNYRKSIENEYLSEDESTSLISNIIKKHYFIISIILILF